MSKGSHVVTSAGPKGAHSTGKTAADASVPSNGKATPQGRKKSVFQHVFGGATNDEERHEPQGRKKSVFQHVFGGAASDAEPEGRKKSVFQHVFGGTASRKRSIEDRVSRHVQRSHAQHHDAAADLEARISRMESGKESGRRLVQSMTERRHSSIDPAAGEGRARQRSVVGLRRSRQGEQTAMPSRGRSPD
jgi:hypothetical protein